MFLINCPHSHCGFIQTKTRPSSVFYQDTKIAILCMVVYMNKIVHLPMVKPGLKVAYKWRRYGLLPSLPSLPSPISTSPFLPSRSPPLHFIPFSSLSSPPSPLEVGPIAARGSGRAHYIPQRVRVVFWGILGVNLHLCDCLNDE